MAALRALRQQLQLGDDEAAIAPLGTPGKGDEGEATLLAGRFQDEQAATVRSLVRNGGGHVVADVDEQWTRPRSLMAETSTTENRVRADRGQRSSRGRHLAEARLVRVPIVR